LIYNSQVSVANQTRRAGKPVFSTERCKRCGICRHFCPFDALDLDAGGYPYLAHPEKCTSCGLCEEMCPDWAIQVREPEGEPSAAGALGPSCSIEAAQCED
jgi:2-oxoglutarate ferredoxin oxidoreductase subunit delta